MPLAFARTGAGVIVTSDSESGVSPSIDTLAHLEKRMSIGAGFHVLFEAHRRLLAHFEVKQEIACEARDKVSRASDACIHGNGPGPDPQDVAQAELLEGEAVAQWKAVVAHLRRSADRS